jgi:2-iminobutanoate/2-iminopropanoate deaminase
MRGSFLVSMALVVIPMASAIVTRSQGMSSTPDRTGPQTTPYGRAAVEAGGLIYVSGVTGPVEGVRPAGDVGTQTKQALARLGTALATMGASLDTVVSMNVVLKRAEDLDAMNAAYREVFAVDPPVRTTIAGEVPDFAAIEISAVAVKVGATREVLLPKGWMKSPRPHSYAIRTDDLVFFSGLVSRRPSDDKVMSGTPAQQTKTILDNARDLLDAADLTFDDVVAARVFVTDDSYFEPMNGVYRTFFPANPPARATVVSELMGESNVEISLIASTKGKQILGASLSPSLPVSAAVRAGARVFLSGVLGDTDANEFDAVSQARESFAKVTHTLTSNGLSLVDVVDSTLYIRGLEDTRPILAVYRELFPSPPATTLIGTRLVPRAALVEVLLTAYK